MTNTNEAVKRVEEFLSAVDERSPQADCAAVYHYAGSGFDAVQLDDLRALIAALEASRSEIKRLSVECETFRSEADKAKAQAKAWNDVIYVEGIPMRYLPDTDFGDKVEPIPYVTPQRLTDLLDEISRLRKALEASEAKCPVCRAAALETRDAEIKEFHEYLREDQNAQAFRGWQILKAKVQALKYADRMTSRTVDGVKTGLVVGDTTNKNTCVKCAGDACGCVSSDTE